MEAFPRLDDSLLRIAQTDAFFRDNQNIPCLQIWFRISRDNSTLILWGVTKEDEDWDDDIFF